ncbi:MAG TPA: hypothetical protein VI078_10465 [bacterium]
MKATHTLRPAAAIAAGLAVLLLCRGGPSHAQGPSHAGEQRRRVRIETRFVDRASGQEAAWGATGQILVPTVPADAGAARWGQVRTVASSPSRQSLTLEQDARGLIRVGREIPFAGWFLGHGRRCGLLEDKTEWRDVESALEVQAVAAGDGALRIALIPEFGYAQGRARRTIAFPAERAEVLVSPGEEMRFAAPAGLEAFYSRLLAGYDPLRRVWSVDMVLRAEFVEP